MGWMRLKKIADVAFLAVGTVLTVYIGVATFGYVKNSSEYYSNFILGVCLMSGLLAVRLHCHEKIDGPQRPWFWPRFGFTIVALIMSTVAMTYVRINAVHLETDQPFFSDTDMIFGWLMTISILMLCAIHWGLLLTGVIAISIVYFFFGYLIPNPLLVTPHYDTKFVMNYIGLGTNQGFYFLTQIAADSIYFLIIYAAALFGVGMLNMVLEVGKVTGRRISGGAAAPAIIGSGIVAAIMGQAVSNVVLTGRLTIPMMKKHGYEGSMAGAIEATASSSGQIMPPVLGLAAFIIASFLNRPYIEIALAATIPALLYLVGVAIAVTVYAKRRNLPRLTEKADLQMIARMSPTFLISFGVVLWLLLGYRSPSIAGLWGIVLALGFSMLQGRYRPKWKELYEAVDEGFVLVGVLSLLLVAIGPLGQVMLTTNLSGRLGTILLQYLPESKLLLLIATMIVSLILGMGLPTPVAYIIVALALVPFLQQIGVPPLEAHFFSFYFAVFSTLTPPVAVSVLAAAKLANASFAKTAIDSMKIAATTFIIPFAFVYSPVLMTFPHLSWNMIPQILEVLAIQFTVSIAAYGYYIRNLNGWERGVFSVAALIGFFAMTLGQIYWHWSLIVIAAAMTVWLYLTRMRYPHLERVAA
jgi:TRAP transporter 4TM/12TM fusion protein